MPTEVAEPTKDSSKLNYVSLIWSIAEILRGDFKAHQYGSIVLPFLVLRRLECVLEPTRKKVLEASKTFPKNSDETIREKLLNRASGQKFSNTTEWTLDRIKGDSAHLLANTNAYINGFTANVRDVLIDRFKLPALLEDLDKANLLYSILDKFSAVDLHPKKVSNMEMGSIFEELIRRFAEVSNETAGEHFTPRDIVELLVDVLFIFDAEVLTQKGIVRTAYDPTAGTGGVLSTAQEKLAKLNPDAKLILFGQELNPESYAICKSDLMIKGQDPDNIKFGNTLSNDQLEEIEADYMGANPPYGVDWGKIRKEIENEHDKLGMSGRFGPGLPRVDNGALLFVLHMLSKMKDAAKSEGSRIAVVLNGSPLFTGGAGSGESEIRRWILENDLLEAVIGLPTDLFYNTSMGTFIWILTNKKQKERRGKVQLIDATEMYVPLKRILGDKRREISSEDRAKILKLLGDFKASPRSMIFRNEDFGYRKITVNRPLLDASGKPTIATKGKFKGQPIPDPNLQDTEHVPLNVDVQEYFRSEIRTHFPTAWIDESKKDKKDGKVGIVGYDISFTRFFYRFRIPTRVEKVLADLENTQHDLITSWKEANTNRDVTAEMQAESERVQRRLEVIKHLRSIASHRHKNLKHSGHMWLGDIPETWNTEKINQLFEERNETVSDSDYAALSVTKHGIVPQLDTVAKTNAGDSRKRIAKGDFVINSRSDRKGSAGVSQHSGSTSLINIVLKSPKIFPGYCHHLLRSYGFQEEFFRWGRGIVADLWSTRYSEMKCISLPIPPLAEQEKIADILEIQTAKIEALLTEAELLSFRVSGSWREVPARIVENRHKTVELLAEALRSFVYEAVTGKIDLRETTT
jgi:type I restriction enzyme M protein